jgi:hypothetical protein
MNMKPLTLPLARSCLDGIVLAVLCAAAFVCTSVHGAGTPPVPGGNPIFRDTFTADPSPLVVGDTLYVYVGHDKAEEGQMFNIVEWLCYSTKDMKTWTPHGSVMKPTDFTWATGEAWASQAIERDGKFYLYTTVQHGAPHVGKAIGVAVASHPLGPFKDARGTALVHDATTPSPYGWNDIDPAVFIDDDGTAWLAWGNPVLYLARLKANMIEFDGPIEKISLPNYTEGPWITKRGELYYLTYPSLAHQGFSERMCYATAPAVTGPWTYRGFLTGPAENSYTIHPGIVEFKGQSYLFYHNATLTLPDGRTGALGRRSVCVEYLFYNDDGSLQPVVQTLEGVSVPPPSPRSHSVPTKVDRGGTDPRLTVVQFVGVYPSAWPGEPVVVSVENPFQMTPTPLGFNLHGGMSSIGQTFEPGSDFVLGRLTLYAGDGFGTDAENTLTLALYDLGPVGGADGGERYTPDRNLLGDGEDLRFAYEPQGAGLLHLDFSKDQQVMLKAGRRYAWELQGRHGSAAFYWRISRQDVYPGGDAYFDRKLAKEKGDVSCDLAFALYPAPR